MTVNDVTWLLWDLETFNVLGSYATEEEAQRALEEMRAANTWCANDFALAREDVDGPVFLE